MNDGEGGRRISRLQGRDCNCSVFVIVPLVNGSSDSFEDGDAGDLRQIQ